MSIPIWPSSLPQDWLRESFSEDIVDNLMRSEGDSGLGKVRPKGAAIPNKFTFKLYLTPTQRATFVTFVNDTLKQGALRFEREHPITGDTVEMRFVKQGDNIGTLSPEGKGYSGLFNVQVMP